MSKKSGYTKSNRRERHNELIKQWHEFFEEPVVRLLDLIHNDFEIPIETSASKLGMSATMIRTKLKEVEKYK